LPVLQNCGVAFGGSRYNAQIIAKDHPNAEIYVNDELVGTGEFRGLYYRNRPLRVELREEGCEPRKKTYDKVARAGSIVATVLLAGIIGLGVDFGTGAAYKPDHKNDKEIDRISTKDFSFNVEYPNCSEN